jgi:fermentation-respiration switch protein FrsA (DUF1100 family)
MRISLGDVTLWFDLSGPSVIPRGDTAVERPTLVAVHGGPGLDQINYFRHEAARFDPWSVLPAIRCPVLVLAGEDDPICPLPVVEDLARQLPVGTIRLVRMPQAPQHLPRPARPGLPGS